jgi:hypothetical protein
MGVLGVIFGIGAGLPAVAAVVATRLPAGKAPNPAGKQPGGELGRAEQAV